VRHAGEAGFSGRSDIVPKVESMERLKRRTDFRAAAAGVRAHAGAFVVQARARGDGTAVRVGFTVSKQVGNAVERNRVRRRLREVVRLAPGTERCAALCAGHDYVLIGRRAALQLPFGDMVRELDTALRRIHAASDAAKRTGTASAMPPHRTSSPAPRRRRGQEHHNDRRPAKSPE
jgi:ribonuclease P protein component